MWLLENWKCHRWLLYFSWTVPVQNTDRSELHLQCSRSWHCHLMALGSYIYLMALTLLFLSLKFGTIPHLHLCYTFFSLLNSTKSHVRDEARMGPWTHGERPAFRKPQPMLRIGSSQSPAKEVLCKQLSTNLVA